MVVTVGAESGCIRNVDTLNTFMIDGLHYVGISLFQQSKRLSTNL